MSLLFTDLTILHDPHQLRREMRNKRRALSSLQQEQNSRAMAKILATSPQFRNSQKIAIYLENDGEIGISEIAPRIFESGKRCYLPVLHPLAAKRLWFSEYRHGDRLLANRYGIYEPDYRQRRPVSPWSLDLVLMPLVAFDLAGNRLGMGGGYYDRTFAYLLQRSNWLKPKLVGVAHDLQRVDSIKRNIWDVPLDAIVTEQSIYEAEMF